MPADLAAGGMLYEPRSLWSVQSVDLSASPSEVRFNREHFYNGTKYPITIKRMAVMGLNYIYARVRNADQTPWQSAAIGARVAISVSAPFRKYFGRNPTILNANCPEPTWGPGPRDTKSSSLWGQTMLSFDHPLYLPRRGAIEWDISTFSSYLREDDESLPLPEAVIYQLYQETGGLFAGACRSRSFRTTELSANGHDTPNLEEGWPYPFDVFHSAVNYGQLTPTTFWPPQGSFTAKEFKAQESTEDGSTCFTDIRTMIDQIDVDADVLELPPPAVARVAPLSMRMGTRIRTSSGGSGDWWWREGAPLALVMDTITPATVFKLPYPITLAPKDTLEVILNVPGKATLPSDATLRANVGISFNGFAAIEG
jgi:hypothetical protein